MARRKAASPHLLPHCLCHTMLQGLPVSRTDHAAQCNTEGKDLMRPRLHGLKALEALRLYLRPGPKGEASKAEICRGSSRRQPIVSPCGGHVASFRGLPSPMSQILACLAPAEFAALNHHEWTPNILKQRAPLQNSHATCSCIQDQKRQHGKYPIDRTRRAPVGSFASPNP